ncbi:hypothetical protein OAI01_01155 [Alphaproteobacteria bacterium]|nr:hypothetical protein [Alphaproteobacteria bacterium]
MKKIFVTTFNNQLFKKYAAQLIDSYVKTYQEIDLYCYVEDDVTLYPKHKNIFYLNLYNEQPESLKFVERNKKKSQKESEISYLLDSVRFSYKVFAQSDARKYADQFFFIDADTEFLKKIPQNWFEECLPRDTVISIYDRLGYYTEAGFIGFNSLPLNKKNQKLLDIFFQQYTSYYVYDLIYSLPAFTDCHALDATRFRFMQLKHYTDNHANYEEKRLGNWIEDHELDVMLHDKFINQYISHKKGNK